MESGWWMSNVLQRLKCRRVHIPTVLIAEPNPVLRQLERQALSQAYCVVSTSGAEEAVRLAARHETKLDLLLTEVRLPNLFGWELTELLKLDYPRLKVVYLSSFVNSDVKARTRSSVLVVVDESRFSPVRIRQAVHDTLGMETVTAA